MRLHLATLGAVVASAFATTTTTTGNTTLEVDLVFPQNKTYTPTEWFPVIFALQNSSLAQYLDMEITYNLRSIDDEYPTRTSTHRFRHENLSSTKTHFAYSYFDMFRSSGSWQVAWSISWRSCNKEGFESGNSISQMLSNTTSFSVSFAVQNIADSVAVDLVSATSEDSCPDTNSDSALAINVPETMRLPSWVSWNAERAMNYTCAITTPTTTIPDPCRVDIDRTVAESMQASHKAWLCRNALNPPEDCPEENEDNENSAPLMQRAIVGGISAAWLGLAVCGELGFWGFSFVLN
ncbi:hypothetical protein BJX61DRAFT_230044 [Aspergillus egyptiacus]|nr:hypothetical protein BJX61DRAFT_230044 [Aspergillus egyptiacus]